jgi:hypothetical protein
MTQPTEATDSGKCTMRAARRAATPEPESEGRPRPQSFLIPGRHPKPAGRRLLFAGPPRRRPPASRKEQVNQVHSAPTSGGSPGRRALAVILAIIGVLAIVAGILYVAGAANSLHFMVGSVHKGHHLVRAAVSFVVGVALLTGAWFTARRG